MRKQSLAFSVGTVLSRVTGLVRDMIVTATFGSSPMLEAFIVANRVPNLFRDMLCEGALGNAFTRTYTSEKDIEKKQRLFNSMITLLIILLGVFSIAGIWVAPAFVKSLTMFASSRGAEFSGSASELSMLLFPFLALAMLNAVVSGALHSKGHFFITSISPVFLNLGYILGAVFLTHSFAHIFKFEFANDRITTLAIGVLIGITFQFLIQFMYFVGDFRFEFDGNSGIKKVFLLMIPAAIAASSGPINSVINTNFATSLESGSVTWLNYAFRLYQLPVGIFGVGIGLVSLPILTRAITAGESHLQVKEKLRDALELSMCFMVFSFSFLYSNAQDIVTVIFERGEFSQIDALQTSKALLAYSFGLFAYGAIKVLTSFYFATDRVAFAMKVSLVAIFVNFVVNYFFVKQFGHVGIAFTSAVTLSFNAFVLIWGTGGIKINWKLFGLLLCFCLASCYLQAFISFENIFISLIASACLVTIVFSPVFYLKLKSFI